MFAKGGARYVEIPMKEMAKAIPDGRPNMIAVGIAGKLLHIPEADLSALIEKQLSGKGPLAIESSRAALRAGYTAAAELDLGLRLAAPPPKAARRTSAESRQAARARQSRAAVTARHRRW